MKKQILLTTAFALALSSATAQKQAVAETCDEVILHAWSWSFNTIRENMADIAAAGYTLVQTSPAQQCVTETRGDKGGGNQIFGKGYWYYHYQPTDWKIGNYQLGRILVVAVGDDGSRNDHMGGVSIGIFSANRNGLQTFLDKLCQDVFHFLVVLAFKRVDEFKVDILGISSEVLQHLLHLFCKQLIVGRLVFPLQINANINAVF